MTLRIVHKGQKLELERSTQSPNVLQSLPDPLRAGAIRAYRLVQYDQALPSRPEEANIVRGEELLQQAMERVHAGGDINQKDSDGYTLLHHACFGERWDVVAWLLAHGADRTIKTPCGLVPPLAVETWRDGQKVHDLAQDVAKIKRQIL
jgi:hypothetical protein